MRRDERKNAVDGANSAFCVEKNTDLKMLFYHLKGASDA